MDKESMGKIYDERTKSDAELIQGGATHEFVGAENPRLTVTTEQREKIRLDHEGGMYPDAATYIKINKVILVPAEKVPNNIKELSGNGWLGSDETLTFIDKDGNIARAKIDYQRISTIKVENDGMEGSEIRLQENRGSFIDELKQNNFNVSTDMGWTDTKSEIMKMANEEEKKLMQNRA